MSAIGFPYLWIPPRGIIVQQQRKARRSLKSFFPYLFPMASGQSAMDSLGSSMMNDSGQELMLLGACTNCASLKHCFFTFSGISGGCGCVHDSGNTYVQNTGVSPSYHESNLFQFITNGVFSMACVAAKTVTGMSADVYDNPSGCTGSPLQSAANGSVQASYFLTGPASWVGKWIVTAGSFSDYPLFVGYRDGDICDETFTVSNAVSCGHFDLFGDGTYLGVAIGTGGSCDITITR
jgi:hypothetical protein